MGRNNTGNTIEINYAENKNKWYKELKEHVLSINNYEMLTHMYVLKVYAMLTNYSLNRNDDPVEVFKYFQICEPLFFDRLRLYCDEKKNKEKLFEATILIVQLIEKEMKKNEESFSYLSYFQKNGTNSYYSYWLEDLKIECGIIIGSKYNNFIRPAIFSDEFQDEAFKYYLVPRLNELNKLRMYNKLEPITLETILKPAVVEEKETYNVHRISNNKTIDTDKWKLTYDEISTLGR